MNDGTCVFVAVNSNGKEIIASNKIVRKMNKIGLGGNWKIEELYNCSEIIDIPKGTIKKIIGKKLTWEDEPVELEEDIEKKRGNKMPKNEKKVLMKSSCFGKTKMTKKELEKLRECFDEEVENGIYVVEFEDILNYKAIDIENILLDVLKDKYKNLPIEGVVISRVEDGWEVTKDIKDVKTKIEFTFKRVENEE